MSFDYGFIMHLYKVEQHIFMAIISSSSFEKHILFFCPMKNDCPNSCISNYIFTFVP